jgi:nitrogen fixation NifU-like protein
MADILQLLRDHYDDPFHRGECEAVTNVASGECQQTGCQIAFGLRVNGARQVAEAWFDGAGCEWCEAVASIVAMACEGKDLSGLQRLSRADFFAAFGLEALPLERATACVWLPYETLVQASRSPVDGLADELENGPNFGGPSLREEC